MIYSIKKSTKCILQGIKIKLGINNRKGKKKKRIEGKKKEFKGREKKN